ncbi:hypothetical protein ACFYT4_33890 [Streptomyces sp. NPDC004609]|uniref:hypothetical protein n=1 Tax=Streptomyces sp. NPDC004609 TaxID=3364704 RepID=UPI0036A57E4C
MVVVQDVRGVPEEHQAIIDDAMNDRMSAALHKVWGDPGPVPVQRGSVALMVPRRCRPGRRLTGAGEGGKCRYGR